MGGLALSHVTKRVLEQGKRGRYLPPRCSQLPPRRRGVAEQGAWCEGTNLSRTPKALLWWDRTRSPLPTCPPQDACDPDKRGSCGADRCSRLAAIRASAQANGVHDLRTLTPEEIRDMEPAVACRGALFPPSTGVGAIQLT